MAKSVGIIGYWYATNYGSVLTYHALYKTLADLNYAPIIIDIPEKDKDPAGEDVFSRQYIYKHCKVSDSLQWDKTKELNDICDTFIIGSDQVWTKDALRIARYFFFLDFASHEKKKISYAPSFGSDRFDITADEFRKVSTLLNGFDAISVREDTGVALLKKQFEIEAQQVLDPVFLQEPQWYDTIASASSMELNDKYILGYILDPTPDKEKALLEIQNRLNLPVKIILDGRKGTFNGNLEKIEKYKECVIPAPSVEDWVKLFEKSAYVFTDSHHGMAMAFIFNKQQTIYANSARGHSRFTSILSLLGIKNHLIMESRQIKEGDLLSELDYTSINDKIKTYRRMSLEWLEKSLSTDNPKRSIVYNISTLASCCGCSSCLNVCPKKAIKMKENKDGFLIPNVDVNLCNNCGKCTSACPILNTQYLNSDHPECYALIAPDEIRRKCSSGGAFPLLSNIILNNGGIVAGAIQNKDCSVSHSTTESVDVTQFYGSKYIQSKIGFTYTEIQNNLQNNKTVLFSGTPCQVAGLKKYLGREYANLYTIDILCHGISSYKILKHYIDDVFKGDMPASLQYKAKEPWGWHAGINAVFGDGHKYSCILEKDPFFVSYIQGLSKNKICGACPFNKIPRQGDITIGDFWKIQDYDKTLNDGLGTSAVLINNEQGKNLFNLIDSKNVTPVPLDCAISGNGCIIYPYRLNPNRDKFFEQINYSPFRDVLEATYYANKRECLLKTISAIHKDLFSMAENVRNHFDKRDIILIGAAPTLSSFLEITFGILLTKTIAAPLDSPEAISILEKGPQHIYIIDCRDSFDRYENLLSRYGFENITDCSFRIIKPIVLHNLDASIGYRDEFGNTISGKGIIKQVILRGRSNTIYIADDVRNLSNVCIDITCNTNICIERSTNFTQSDAKINVQGYSGASVIDIGSNCRFMTSVITVFNSWETSTLHIGDKTTFGDNLGIHVNSGKRLFIGNDCLFSHDVEMWAGDGHSIFDINSEKNINSNHPDYISRRDKIFIGDHVWIGVRSIILNGTEIGNGSILGAGSVIKRRIPNNCTAAGNPAQVLKKDVAWSHDMCSDRISSCGAFINHTKDCPAHLNSCNVLVIGGSQANGIYLVKALLKYGNRVTIANRGNKNDGFGQKISRIIVDVNDKKDVCAKLGKRYFDVVFNNIAYNSNSTENILNCIQCKRYVQLSSSCVYGPRDNAKESDFNALTAQWNFEGSDYCSGKRNSEKSLIQRSKDMSYVIPRIPHMLYSGRLDTYIESIICCKPLNVDLNAKYSFLRHSELGEMLVWIASQDFNGVVNLSSTNSISNKEIIEYIEQLCRKKTVISPNGIDPGFSRQTLTLNTDLLANLGYVPSDVDEWFWALLDELFEKINKRLKEQTK